MSRLDLDLSVPAVNLDHDTTPVPLEEQPIPPGPPGYVLDTEATTSPKGVWYVRGDGHRILVPRDRLKEPSSWALL